jgi:hypothetical protein
MNVKRSWGVVIEHCHETGLIRGLAHSLCNNIERYRNKPGLDWYDDYRSLYTCFPALSLGWTYYAAQALPKSATAFQELVEKVLNQQYFSAAAFPELYMSGQFFENLLSHAWILRHRAPKSEWTSLDGVMTRVCHLRRTDHQLGINSTRESDRGGPWAHSCHWCPP